MADAVAPVSVAKALIPLVTTAVVELGKLGWNAEGKLGDLEKNLELIKAFLRDTEMTPDAGVVGAWLKQLQDVTAEVEQEVAELTKITVKLANRSENWEGAIPGIMYAGDSVKLGYKVNTINEKLEKIFKRATDLGLQGRVNFVSASSSSGKETGPLLGDPALVVPRDSDVSKVVDMLISCSSSNTLQSLPVVSIVGMAGLGKTTLARMVLKDDRLKSLFKTRQQLWVCVSANFDVDWILCQILEDLTREPATSFEKLKRTTIVTKIEEKLEGKSFLLVLDDVWNEDTQKWDQLMKCLLGIHNNVKSIILTTTRSQKVVLAMLSPQEFTHQISMLDDDQCWSMIKAQSFGQSCVPHNFEVTGKEIGKKCKGVALVASVIGGTLRIERTEDAWSLIKESNLWNSLETDEEIISVLRLSYDRLGSSSLKKCFEFCSIFPEDSFLYREKLIQLWMAAGFLDPSLTNYQHSRTAWDIGSKNFDTLVSNSLFQDVETDGHGNIRKCKMHDSIRSLARSLSKAMALISDANSSIDVSSIAHLNIIGVEGEQAERLIQGNAPKLLQSLFCGIDTFRRISGKCKGLKILKLVGPGNKLPSSVGDLKDLRYFDVSETKIEELPKSIAKLQKLQTLNVRGCWHLKQLPKQMEKFVELWHLDFEQEKLMPVNIGILKSLHILPVFYVGIENGCGIEELGRLTHLQGELKVVNLEHVRCKEKAREAKLNEKKGIRELILVWGWSEEKVEVGQEEGVLEGLQPPLNLKGLMIQSYRGRDFPTWLPSTTVKNSKLSLQFLTSLTLFSCNNCEKLPSLGHLPNLTHLSLECLKSVKSIDIDFYGGSNFPALKEFELYGMYSLEVWVETTEINMFPSLEVLRLNACHELRNIPLTNGLPHLQRMIIHACDKLSHIGNGLSSCKRLREIRIHYCNNLEFLPRLRDLRSLQNLTLSRCSKLSYAAKDLQCCTALQTLQLQHCSEMFPRLDFLERLESLVRLEIEGCGSITWGDSDNSDHRVTHLEQVELEAEQFPYFLTTYLHASLQSLTLLGTAEIKCLPDQMQRLTALQTLKLHDFDGLEALPLSFGHLSSLEELQIRGCWNLKSLSPLKTMLKLKSLLLDVGHRGSSEGFPPLFDSINECIPSSLQRLTLYGCGHVNTLPPQIQHMTALKELEIHHIFGIKALPQWLQNLSSLQQLQIIDCPDLTNLPNISNLKLLVLKIRYCYKLTSGDFFNGSYSEWSKISAPTHHPRRLKFLSECIGKGSTRRW